MPAIRDFHAHLNRYYWPWLGGLLVAVLLARIAILTEFLRDNPFSQVLFSDAWVYWYQAAQKAGGAWLEASPFLQAPLYPNLLGLFRWAGGDLTTLYVIQLLIGLLTIGLVADATRRRFGTAAGLLAALLFALLTEPALAFLYVLADSLQLFLAALAWWCWVRLAEVHTPTWPGILTTGAVLGLLALAWAPAQLLIPVYAIWLLTGRDRLPLRFGKAIAGVVVAAVIISPATVHNYLVDGTFIPVSANGGINLYQGNNPDAEGIVTAIPGIRNVRQHMFHDAALLVERKQGRPDNWKAVDDYFRDQATVWLRSNPLDAAQLIGHKLFWFATATDYDNVSVLSLEREHGLYRLASLAPLQLPWLLGLVALGVLLCLREPRRFAPELLLVGLALLVCILFYYSGRFRLPLTPVACALAAVALIRWRDLPLSSGWRYGIAWLPLPLLLLNLLTGWASVDFQRETTDARVAHAYMEVADRRVVAGETESVTLYYRRAIAAAPDYPGPYLRLAVLEYRHGDPATTAAIAEHALVAGVRELPLFYLLYNAYLDVGNEAAALAVIWQAQEYAPDDPALQQAKVWLYATAADDQVRDPQAAVDFAEKTLREHGRQRRTGLIAGLGIAYWQAGDRDRALRVMEQAERLAPFSMPEQEAAIIAGQVEQMRTGGPLLLHPLRLPLPDPWQSLPVHP